ncbi:MAG: cytidylate kinase-like family protein [Desulfobacterales bacterium]|nr:cytidylate kinase-like family protein [Desulfobacterales bacterium]
MALITITRQIGSGAMAIARKVAEGLGLELFDDERLQQEAAQAGMDNINWGHLNEKAPGFIDRILSTKPDIYLDFMEAVIYNVAHKGQGIIIGHGSPLLLRDFDCALHIFVHASDDTRVQNLMQHQDLSQEVAKKLIQRSDKEHNGFFQYAFQMNVHDLSLYDLVINAAKLGINQAAQTIMNVATSKVIDACSLTALDAMKRHGLHKKIHAELLKHNITLNLLTIDVPATGVVHISGLAFNHEDRELIPKILAKIPEISQIQNHVSVRPTSAS